MERSKVEIYTDKQGRRRRRLVPIDTTDQRPRSKSKARTKPVKRPKDSLPMDPRRRSTPMGPRGNPAVVETYEDARENQMINRNVPTMKHGGEAKTRGMGCAIKGGKFEGVF